MVAAKNVGNYSIFQTYEEEEGRIKATPIYYVDHQTESIVGQEIWECNCTTFMDFPGHNSNLIC